MQIFLSHSSRQKPLVREIRKCLPAHLASWIDEEGLLFGDHIAGSIEKTIKVESDYVLLFIDQYAAGSDWVRREVAWTFEAEQSVGRGILLPIVLDEDAAHLFGHPLTERKYLVLQDFQETSVRRLGDAIASELFALVCRDMRKLRTPAPRGVLAVLDDAQRVLQSQAELIQKAVFPHRRANPIDKATLLRVVNSQTETLLSEAELDAILHRVLQHHLVPGLYFDGYELFVVEEHASWKSAIEQQKKARIARAAAGLVRNGAKVLLDAGSTIEQVVADLCTRIERRALTRLTVATTSINIADMISDCCVKMGFDDEFSAVQLFVPGGRVRPGTQAIVPHLDGHQDEIMRLAEQIGGFDLALVGVNGVDEVAGFTTHEEAEAANKRALLAAATRNIVLGDSSKVGIVLECPFADFQSPVTYIVDRDPENATLSALEKTFPDKLMFC